MKALILSTPADFDPRGDVDEHQCGGVDVVLADSDQAGTSTHRRADQHGTMTAHRGNDAGEVLHHDVLAVVAVGRPNPNRRGPARRTRRRDNRRLPSVCPVPFQA